MKLLNKLRALFFGKDGEPIRCVYCGCRAMRSNTTGMLNYLVCESEEICEECGKRTGEWAYGYWHPDYERYALPQIFKYMPNRLYRGLRRWVQKSR
jgi:hypothetical protein